MVEGPRFSRDELEAILGNWAVDRRSGEPISDRSLKPFFQGLTLEELEAIARFLLD